MGWHKALFLLRQTALLTGPLIYFYVLSFTRIPEFRAKHLLHAAPFATSIIFLLLYFSGQERFVIWQSPLDLITTIIILGVNLTYIIIAFISFKTGRVSFSEWFSNLKKSPHVSWIQYILLGFIVLWTLNLNISAVWMITQKPLWCAYSRSIYELAVFLFPAITLFIIMLQPAAFFMPGKYKNSAVNEDEKSRYKQVLKAYMEHMKPYLNPDITLDTVAKEISVNARSLSQIINESYQNNFNGFINEYRIRESLRQLSDSTNTKTILEIVYDSGFNSKSAFYAEFKRHTGMTPQEYRSKSKVQEKIMAN
jgi:AraC-like DNA-binding protein